MRSLCTMQQRLYLGPHYRVSYLFCTSQHRPATSASAKDGPEPVAKLWRASKYWRSWVCRTYYETVLRLLRTNFAKTASRTSFRQFDFCKRLRRFSESHYRCIFMWFQNSWKNWYEQFFSYAIYYSSLQELVKSNIWNWYTPEHLR